MMILKAGGISCVATTVNDFFAGKEVKEGKEDVDAEESAEIRMQSRTHQRIHCCGNAACHSVPSTLSLGPFHSHSSPQASLKL